MATKKTKTKARKTAGKTAVLKSNVRKSAKNKSSDDLNDVAARLMQQSERSLVTQAAALLIQKNS
ncbi:MAG TPA: hypothetical protein VGN44_02320 [Candidatus Angelobacter sp.]|jgi:hypothetical protein